MFERVVVIGAGAAGVAACWAAAQRGAHIRLFDDGLGASCLQGGAVDDRPWEEVARSVEVLAAPAVAGALPEALDVFVRDLGLWRLPAVGEPLTRLPTAAGRIRVARGCDLAMLDLSRLPRGARVVLPRVAREEWDADSLAHALSVDDDARALGLSFEAVDATVLKHLGEDRIAGADLAARHDDPERLAWLIERLGEMLARHGRAHAVLTGPWLGAAEARAPALSEKLRVPVGEVLALPGGAPGLRFEAARARLLARIGVVLERRRAEALLAEGEMRVRLAGGEEVVSDSVVLAIGGVAAGGIVYDPPEQRAGLDMPDAGSPAFRLSLSAPVELAWRGKTLDMVSSVHGPPLDDVAWPTDADPSCLESVGVLSLGLAAAGGADSIYVAGDIMADRPRTLLQAVFSGIRAGAAAAGEPGAM